MWEFILADTVHIDILENPTWLKVVTTKYNANDFNHKKNSNSTNTNWTVHIENPRPGQLKIEKENAELGTASKLKDNVQVHRTCA